MSSRRPDAAGADRFHRAADPEGVGDRGCGGAGGRRLTAHISQHTTLNDGRVRRTESFDCYEPFAA